MLSLRGKVFVVIAFLYFLFPNPRPDFSVFNSHDSEGYLALSYSLLHGQGYTRNIDSPYIPHTLWPPGMPLILMPAVAASGNTINWYYVKFTLIFVSVIGLWLIWKFLFFVTSKKIIADLGFLIFVLNPYYWHFSRLALSELPVFIWMILSFFLIHYIWSKSSKYWQVGCVGLICGLGMLLKGTVIGLAFVPLAYLFQRYKTKTSVAEFSGKYIVFFIAFFIAFTAWNIRNSSFDREQLGFDGVNQVQMLFKAEVEDPSSRFRTLPEFIQTAKENILWHGIYHYTSQIIPIMWLLELKSLSYGNVLALISCSLIVFLSFPRNVESLACYILIGPMFVMMLLMVIGGSERYWVAISFLSIICILINFKDTKLFLKLERIGFKWGKLSLSVIMFFLLSNLYYIYVFEKAPYNSRDNYVGFADFINQNAKLCVDSKETNLVIDTRNFSAVRLITGCLAPMKNERLGIIPSYNSKIMLVIEPLPQNASVLSRNSTWQLVKFD